MTRAADTPARAAGGLDARAAELVRAAVLADLARRVVADCGVDVGLVGVPDRPRPRIGAAPSPAGPPPGGGGGGAGTGEAGGRDGGPAGMVLRHWSGTRAGLLHDLVVPSGTGLGGRALAERAATWVPDYRAATTISHEHDAAVDAEDLYAMLTVPLLHDGAVHGVVYAALRDVVPFGDVRIGAVAELAATATRALAGAAAWARPDDRRPAARPRPRPGGPDLPAPHRPSAGHPAARARPPARLTPREHEVLRWAATGRTNPEIAAQLGLTCNTVTGYLKSAMHKLGVRNRVELALTARESGLLG
ncbi:LuxR C-terminal-related transcriptional regulator [Kitasatospora sp. NBC_00240]|uniref:helix-turn-helix transcriptional regulator n=1 Tax=Kitasatospora sp. NBC_00240 TaxID=2903567 RepID=UPI002257B65A|nr:LuxR C-terminal-related transcriptional regulator [Kitasatospora sp. NBC_00240]MCX5213807.1 LuxR C-terminal-related transcriptional regulator [Kitasatospora sp. NBC_00240]